MRRFCRKLVPVAALSLLMSVLTPDSQAQEVSVDIEVIGGAVEQRIEAVLALCATDGWSQLLYVLGDSSPHVREIAVSCWDVDEGGTAPLLSLLDDGHAGVRASLVTTLGRASSAESQELISGFLDDPSVSVRAAAIRNIELLDGEQAALLMGPFLESEESEIYLEAAVRIAEQRAWYQLTERERSAYDRAIVLHQVLEETPEVVGVLSTLLDRIELVHDRMSDRALGGDFCADATVAGVRGLRDQVEASIEVLQTNKVEDRVTLAINQSQSLRELLQAYGSCSGATLLQFGGEGIGDPFSGRTVTMITEMRSIWSSNFGQLRTDLVDSEDGGELWAQSRLGVGLFLPGRPLGEQPMPSSDSITASVVGRLRRNQLFRNQELSNWNGGAFARTHISSSGQASSSGLTPNSGLVDSTDSLTLDATAYVNRATGDDDDYPTRLVSAHDIFGIDADLKLDLGDDEQLSLRLEADRLRYQSDQLDPAGRDSLGALLSLDSGMQLRAGARHRAFGATGPALMSPFVDSGLDRDGVLLDAMFGVLFGERGYGDAVLLYVLGGTTIPIMSSFEPRLDPQITFDLKLATRLDDGYIDLFRFELGGRRTADSSPRDFALQAVTESYVRMYYRGLDLPSSGVEFEFGVSYVLVDHIGPMTSLRELETSSIRIGLGVRFLLEEWLGFDISNWVRAFGADVEELDLQNRFSMSVFVPIGGYGFEIEEPTPW